MLLGQASAQKIGKQIVIAIPLPLLVKREKEQAHFCDLIDHRSGIGLPGHCIAKIEGDPRSKSRAEIPSSLAIGAGGPFQRTSPQPHVLDRIPAKERRLVGLSAESQHGELKRGDPALGTRLDGSKSTWVEVLSPELLRNREISSRSNRSSSASISSNVRVRACMPALRKALHAKLQRYAHGPEDARLVAEYGLCGRLDQMMQIVEEQEDGPIGVR